MSGAPFAPDGCEWFPAEDRPARMDDVPHAVATVSVGANGAWHLCASCAALPRFKRFRVRKQLTPATPTTLEQRPTPTPGRNT